MYVPVTTLVRFFSQFGSSDTKCLKDQLRLYLFLVVFLAAETRAKANYVPIDVQNPLGAALPTPAGPWRAP